MCNILIPVYEYGIAQQDDNRDKHTHIWRDIISGHLLRNGNEHNYPRGALWSERRKCGVRNG